MDQNLVKLKEALISASREMITEALAGKSAKMENITVTIEVPYIICKAINNIEGLAREDLHRIYVEMANSGFQRTIQELIQPAIPAKPEETQSPEMDIVSALKSMETAMAQLNTFKEALHNVRTTAGTINDPSKAG